MSAFTVNLPINCDANKLFDQVSNKIGEVLTRGNSCRQAVGGGVFYSKVSGGNVVAMYNHPSRYHSATADGGLLGGGQVKSIAEPGVWAIATSRAGIKDRKTYWNVQ